MRTILKKYNEKIVKINEEIIRLLSEKIKIQKEEKKELNSIRQQIKDKEIDISLALEEEIEKELIFRNAKERIKKEIHLYPP